MPQRRELLDSPANERVREIQSLSRRCTRLDRGATVAEGPQAVAEALCYAAESITDIFVSEDGEKAHPLLLEKVQDAASSSETFFLHRMSKRVSKAMGTACQGWIARVGLSGFPTLGSVSEGSLCLLLPATQDPGNMGTMIRLADACGAKAVFVGQNSADPVSPKVIRFSTGSVFHLPTPRFSELEPVVDTLKAAGWLVAGTAGRGDTVLDPVDLSLWETSKVAWMMGNESRGLSEEQEKLCDVLVSIPMYGQAESLNVTSAATLALWLTATAQQSKPAGRNLFLNFSVGRCR